MIKIFCKMHGLHSEKKILIMNSKKNVIDLDTEI